MGTTVQMEVSLSDIEPSLSGFQVTVSIGDETLAQIVAVEFADYSDPVTGIQITGILESLPASSVTIAAVDLSQSTLQGPFEDVVIATISVDLLGSGSTLVSVVPPPRIDDYEGQLVSVTLISGSLSIDP